MLLFVQLVVLGVAPVGIVVPDDLGIGRRLAVVK